MTIRTYKTVINVDSSDQFLTDAVRRKELMDVAHTIEAALNANGWGKVCGLTISWGPHVKVSIGMEGLPKA